MEIPRHWRLRRQRYAIVGQVNPCANVCYNILTPRDVCPECGGEANLATDDSRKAQVYAVPRMYRIPAG